MTPPDLSAFGPVTVLAPLPGGHRNPVWRVARAGVALVAKHTTRSESALRWLIPVQEAARAAGFTVPALLPAGDGRLVAGGVTLEPFVEGRPGQAADLPALAPRPGPLSPRAPRGGTAPRLCLGPRSDDP